MNLFKRLINFIYPNKCIFCDKILPFESPCYCEACFYKLPIKDENQCLICSRQIYGNGYKICTNCQSHKMYFDANYSPFIYEGIIKDAVRRFKFSGKMWYANTFCDFVFNEINGKIKNAHYIVYPPTNKKTFYKRRYNQAQILAIKLSKKMNIPCLKNAVIKTRENEKQSLTTHSNRFLNVRGAFKLNKKFIEQIKNKNILIVDDVLTTGATASEIGKILKKAGVKTVYVAALSITR